MTPLPTLPIVRQNARIVEADEFQTIQPTQRTEIPISSYSNQPLSNIYKVRVSVLNQKMLIPIQRNKMDELKISWLSEEIAKRYYHLEGAEPIIRLKTKDGAILSEMDPLSLIYNEDLESEIISWKSISLSERYKEACSTFPKKDIPSNYCRYKFNNNPDSCLIRALDACSATKYLNLSNFSLTCDKLAPVLKALKHQRNLDGIDLSGNAIGDEGLNMLAQCLEKCAVEDINVSCNNITSKGVNAFCESLSKIDENLLNRTSVLDFSFNPIGRSSADSLRDLFGKLNNLKIVRTDYCE